LNTGFWWGNLREGGHLEDPGIDGRIILRLIFIKWDWGGGKRTGWFGWGIEKGGGTWKGKNKSWGFVKS